MALSKVGKNQVDEATNFTVQDGTIKLDGNYPVGTGNVALGDAALSSGSLSGDYNVAIGNFSLAGNTTASGNVSIGRSTLGNNQTGSANTAIGSYDGTSLPALYYNTSGSYNTATGVGALANTTTSYNTAVGYQAGYSNQTGVENVFIGAFAGYTGTTVQRNTFIGQNAGYFTTGSYNTFIGRKSDGGGAGQAVTTGASNVIIGGYSGNNGGLDIRTLSNRIVLSDGDGTPRLYSNNVGMWMINDTAVINNSSLTVNTISGTGGVAIKSGAYYRQLYQSSDQNFYFNNGSNQAYLSSAGSWTNASDARLKTNVRDIEYGLSTVVATQPRHFERVDVDGTYIGFVAQELQDVIPEVVSGDSETQLGVDYGSLVAVAFKAIKEQQETITALTARIEALEAN